MRLITDGRTTSGGILVYQTTSRHSRLSQARSLVRTGLSPCLAGAKWTARGIAHFVWQQSTGTSPDASLQHHPGIPWFPARRLPPNVDRNPGNPNTCVYERQTRPAAPESFPGEVVTTPCRRDARKQTGAEQVLRPPRFGRDGATSAGAGRGSHAASRRRR